jgi:hypothetical protein
VVLSVTDIFNVLIVLGVGSVPILKPKYTKSICYPLEYQNYVSP